MTEGCQECGINFLNDESHMDHLVLRHERLLQDYINTKWGRETECPGRMCEAAHKTRDLRLSSVCSCGYPVGRWAFRLAARFVAASTADEET